MFETLPSLLCLHITYQQLEALQVLSNAFVGRREIAFCGGNAGQRQEEEQKLGEAGGARAGLVQSH